MCKRRIFSLQTPLTGSITPRVVCTPSGSVTCEFEADKAVYPLYHAPPVSDPRSIQVHGAENLFDALLSRDYEIIPSTHSQKHFFTTESWSSSEERPKSMPPTDDMGTTHEDERPRIPNNSRHDLPQLNSDNINQIEREEDLIRDAREGLLGSRFRLKDKRGELRDLRQKTGQEEGALISQVRKIFQEKNIAFPIELENSFARVLGLRDTLGLVEGSFEEEEEKYDQLEWDYTEKESEFVAKWTDQKPSVLERERAAKSQDRNLHEFEQMELGTMTAGFPVLRPETILVGGQQPLPITEAALKDFEQRSSASRLPQSLPNHVNGMSSPLPMSYNGTAIIEADLAWNNTRKLIDDWILDTVSCSRHQKLILRSLISQDNLDDATWWRLVTRYWDKDGQIIPPKGMHAEESCSSDDIVIPQVASAPANALSDKAETGHVELQHVSRKAAVSDTKTDRHKSFTKEPNTMGFDDQPELESDHLNFEDLNIQSSTTSLDIVLTTVDEQPGNPFVPQIATSSEQQLESNEGIPQTLSSGHCQGTTQDTKSKYNHELCAKPFIVGEGTIPRTKRYHIRHISNPEQGRLIPTVYQPKYHEDPNTTFRPRHG
jgi:hypothetical protein